MNTISEQIQSYLEPLIQQRKFSGAIWASHKGSIVYSNGFGKANYEHEVGNTTKTKFRIGSITKTFMGVAILQLVQKGKLNLEDPVSRYYPNQKNGDKITIHHLLTHTSGIPNYTDDPNVYEWIKHPTSLEHLIHRFSQKELEFPSGDQFKYSNSGYALLGSILEKVAEETYEQYLIKHIFDPLGMKDSLIDSPRCIIKLRASGYRLSEDGILVNAPYMDTSNAYSSGDIISTVEDLHLWDQALYTEQLLGKPFIDLMFTPYKGANNEMYGYGWLIQDTPFGKLVWHDGSIIGFSSVILRHIESKVCILALCNIQQNINEIGLKIAEIIHQNQSI